MAEYFVARPRVAPRRASRRGFAAFCGLLVLLISLLIASSLHAGRATAGRVARPAAADQQTSDGRTGGGHDHGATQPKPPPTGTKTTLQRLIDAGQPIYCGAGTQPLVALTFDDGPGVYTQRTIDLLRQEGMTATFFTVGKLYDEPRFQGLLKQEARLGAVGDHTWDHVPVKGMSTSELAAQIARTRRVAEADSGHRVFLFRPPLGQHDSAVDAYVRSLGMLEIMWSVDSEDSQGAGAGQIFRTVRAHLSPGDIVLLHENRGTTQDALPRILALIARRGYRTVTVPQLLSMDPPTHQQLRQHTCPS
jgi:peptidoglycan/xylan/chitin deacetylase (PgdA/CDA1 family)